MLGGAELFTHGQICEVRSRGGQSMLDQVIQWYDTKIAIDCAYMSKLRQDAIQELHQHGFKCTRKRQQHFLQQSRILSCALKKPKRSSNT